MCKYILSDYVPIVLGIDFVNNDYLNVVRNVKILQLNKRTIHNKITTQTNENPNLS